MKAYRLTIEVVDAEDHEGEDPGLVTSKGIDKMLERQSSEEKAIGIAMRICSKALQGGIRG